MRFIASVLIVATLVSTGWAIDNAAPAEKTAEDDLKTMQGRWTREYVNPQGAPFRVEKLIDENRDGVTHFDAMGNAIHAHQATFKLRREGEVRIFTYSNLEIVAGANTGAKQPGPASYIYRLEGDLLFEFHGALDGDRTPPTIIVWKRVKKS